MDEAWTIAGLIQWAESYFAEKGIPSPRLDAELLLARVLGRSRIQLYTQWEQPLTDAELQGFKTLLKRRAAREPLAYILGEKEFYSLGFEVSSQVLVPRPETEDLVERGLEFLKFRDATEPHLLDLATGSGCLLLALLKNHPAASGIGVDLSAGALETAARNARRHGLEGRVQWLPMDLREPWPSALAGPFDLITANLPYVSEAEYPHLEPELKSYEPRAALVAGPLGTEAFHWVLPNLSQRLQPGGLALLELGSDQGEELRQLAQRHCPELAVELARDLSGRDRVLSLKRPGK